MVLNANIEALRLEPRRPRAEPYAVVPHDGKNFNGTSCTGSPVTGKKTRLTAVGSSVSVSRFTSFDDVGRILASSQETDGYQYNFAYTYNKAGGLETQEYPSGFGVKTCYDAAGRIKEVTDVGASVLFASNFTYEPHGAVGELKLGNNLWEHTDFNDRLQPIEIGLGTSQGGTQKLNLEFEYESSGGAEDNNGNVRKQIITPPGLSALTQSYTYDSVNRLSGITEGGWSRTYGYDRYDNRRASGQNVFTDTPQNESDFDAATNRLTSGWADYDAAGSLERFKPSGFQFTIAYDAANRQTGYCPGTQTACAQVAAGSKTAYHYDGQGRRVKKVVDGTVTTVYAYDAFGHLAAEYTDGSAPSSGTYYRTTDHLGSTRLISNAAEGKVGE